LSEAGIPACDDKVWNWKELALGAAESCSEDGGLTRGVVLRYRNAISDGATHHNDGRISLLMLVERGYPWKRAWCHGERIRLRKLNQNTCNREGPLPEGVTPWFALLPTGEAPGERARAFDLWE
jgi:hypothetical protein